MFNKITIIVIMIALAIFGKDEIETIKNDVTTVVKVYAEGDEGNYQIYRKDDGGYRVVRSWEDDLTPVTHVDIYDMDGDILVNVDSYGFIKNGAWFKDVDDTLNFDDDMTVIARW